MSFVSAAFLVYLPVTVLLYRFLPRPLKRPALLAASWFFYACAAPWTLLLLLAVTLLTWGCALRLPGSPHPKRWTALALTGCLGTLFVFKYLGFTLDTVSGWLGVSAPVVRLALPVGISFYTFQALGYVLDVAAGRIAPERSPVTYALFVSFFPQLVAGPIERSADLLPQLRALPQANGADMTAGLLLLLRGYVKKLLLADLAAPAVEAVFSAAPGSVDGTAVLLGTALFALQIYGDFAGYSDIARGCAALMGFRLTPNFDRPYAALTLRDFWRRWHITLTRWLTDYIYKPLGGARKGRPRRLLNILIVFAVSGLWHGAAWTYVAWGLLHGLLMALETLLPLRLNAPRTRPGRLLRRLVTLTAVGVAWVFFRADSVPAALTLLSRLTVGWNAALTVPASLGLTWPRAACLLAALAALRGLDGPEDALPSGDRLAVLILLLTAACLCGALALAAGGGTQAFIYFQF